MNLPDRITRGLRQLAGHLYRLPQAVIKRTGLSRQQHARDVLEAERLDRIRNPHKYRGR